MAPPGLQQGAHVPQCQRWAADGQFVSEAQEAIAEKVKTEEVETIETLEVKCVEAK